MLNVCFNESQCGMIKYILKEKVTYSYTDLELGKIEPTDFDEARKEWVDFCYHDWCLDAEKEHIWKDQKKRFQHIIEAARQGEELRIWVSTAPFAKCGYYHLIYSLREVDCRIFVVEMPLNIGTRQDVYDRSWGEAKPEEMKTCLSLQKKISLAERAAIAQKWIWLLEGNGELRLNINGKLTTVPADYLDDEILSYAPDGEFKMIELMGETLSNCKHWLNPEFIARRIWALVEKVELIIIEYVKCDTGSYYHSILKKAD